MVIDEARDRRRAEFFERTVEAGRTVEPTWVIVSTRRVLTFCASVQRIAFKPSGPFCSNLRAVWRRAAGDRLRPTGYLYMVRKLNAVTDSALWPSLRL